MMVPSMLQGPWGRPGSPGFVECGKASSVTQLACVVVGRRADGCATAGDTQGGSTLHLGRGGNAIPQASSQRRILLVDGITL